MKTTPKKNVPYVQFIRDSQNFYEILNRRPSAYILLSIIAMRAKRVENNSNFNDLKIGESYIGDHKIYGATRQNYRTDLKFLKSNHFLTTRVTTNGTIAKLIDKSIFDINENSPNHKANQKVTICQPSSNHQVTTKKNDKNDKNDKNTINTSKEVLTKQEQENLEIIPMATNISNVCSVYKHNSSRMKKSEVEKYNADAEHIYCLYADIIKSGKRNFAIGQIRHRLSEGTSKDQLEACVSNYRKQCEVEETETRFRKNAEIFFNSDWKDYLHDAPRIEKISISNIGNFNPKYI